MGSNVGKKNEVQLQSVKINRKYVKKDLSYLKTRTQINTDATQDSCTLLCIRLLHISSCNIAQEVLANLGSLHKGILMQMRFLLAGECIGACVYS